MKKFIFISILLFFSCFNVKAESCIYVFAKGLVNSDVEFAIDGNKVCDLKGSINKEFKAKPSIAIEEPYYSTKDCYRKILINMDDVQDIILTITISYKHIITKDIITYKCEYPITIEDGRTYYIASGNKGWNDVKIEEISEKQAVKLMKKYEQLSEFIYTLK